MVGHGNGRVAGSGSEHVNKGRGAAMPGAASRAALMLVAVLGLAAMVIFVAWALATGSLVVALGRGAMVLMLALPCVVGLALPVAVWQKGPTGCLWERQPGGLARFGRVDTVVFSSSRMLTRGRPRVIHAVPMNGETESRLVRLADAAEADSDHPLAKAVALYAERVGNFRSRATDFKPHGEGVEAVVDGRIVRVGKASWLASLGVCFHHEGEVLDALEADGNTTLVVASEKTVLGFLAVSDSMTDRAEAAVASLKQMGLTVLFLTGAPAASAGVLASQLGMDGVLADLPSGEKGGAVAALRDRGKNLCVVGDGSEDAPAMAKADLAVDQGNPLHGTPEDVFMPLVHALGAGRSFLGTLHRNLLFSAFFALLLFPSAAGLCRDLTRLPGVLRDPSLMIWGAFTALACLIMVLSSLYTSRKGYGQRI
ncbi:HAD-IC family P-type ATPase [Desulfoluna butyratoxydans]|uniref:p-type atpase n=1 Tax=Desulfoluna butyratoxydans TaxID=231438 RepID=A0A4U8YKV6_9BACT|nr:HAD-IC family P-type ATPase [Desulfoluna butyratoxydans]VFQ44004.1 p-type atpase [Desulfoluna butyratoxydans]